MLLDDLLNAPIVGKFVGIGLELNRDLRAALTFGGWGQGIFAIALGLPTPRLVIGAVGARAHRHFVGHHKDRVETNAKLADNLLGGGFASLLGVGQEGFGP